MVVRVSTAIAGLLLVLSAVAVAQQPQEPPLAEPPLAELPLPQPDLQPPPASTPVEVLVDRQQLARGETLNLTIRVHDQDTNIPLDISPLNEQFEVISSSTNHQIVLNNGRIKNTMDYILTLFPREEGELSIPSLRVNNTVTAPVPITVVSADSRSNQIGNGLFLELEVDKESVYVREQLLLTRRLYFANRNIRQPDFDEVNPADTVKINIGNPSQYETIIDGVSYGVHETRSVIFPQRSGEMVIPDIMFRGEITDGPGNRVFRNTNVRRVTAFTEGMTIEVKERPTEAQDSALWLPATSMQLSQEFTADPNALFDPSNPSALQVGDSVIRSVTLTARGLDGAMLPAFSPDSIDGMNMYPNPPTMERSFSGGSLVGTRTESATLVPTASGEVILPEISVPWWNLDTEQMETATLPALRLNIGDVQGQLPPEQAVSTSGNLERLLAEAPAANSANIAESGGSIEIPRGWLNFGLLLLLAGGGYALWHFVILPRRQTLIQPIQSFAVQQRDRLRGRYSPANFEPLAFRQLLADCASGNESSMRKSLILWCAHLSQLQGGSPISTMEQILQQPQFAPLHPLTTQLQSGLYHSENLAAETDAADTVALLNTLKSIRRQQASHRKAQAQDSKYSLPPLYRV